MNLFGHVASDINIGGIIKKTGGGGFKIIELFIESVEKSLAIINPGGVATLVGFGEVGAVGEDRGNGGDGIAGVIGEGKEEPMVGDGSGGKNHGNILVGFDDDGKERIDG